MASKQFDDLARPLITCPQQIDLLTFWFPLVGPVFVHGFHLQIMYFCPKASETQVIFVSPRV